MTGILINTAAKIAFVMVDTSGVEVTGLGTGFTVQLSKNGGTFGASAGTKAEIGSGWYSYVFAVAETDTAGPLAVKVTGAGAAQQNLLYEVAAADTLAADVWSYATRTLTQSASAIAAAVSGSALTITRGDTFSASLTGIGALTGYTSVDFTVKADKNDADTSAVIRIRKNASALSDGLLTLNGATGIAAQGSLTINNEALGNITIALSAIASDDLAPSDGLHYDIQLITANGVITLTEGLCNITADVTRAVS